MTTCIAATLIAPDGTETCVDFDMSTPFGVPTIDCQRPGFDCTTPAGAMPVTGLGGGSVVLLVGGVVSICLGKWLTYVASRGKLHT